MKIVEIQTMFILFSVDSGKTHLCLKLVTTNGVQDGSDSDNVQCVDLTTGTVLIDAIRGSLPVTYDTP